jgi:endonuclease-3
MKMVKFITENGQSALNSLLDAKGNYTLLFSVAVRKRMKIGKLGLCTFPEGSYAYTGSAFGRGSSCLGRRILRHTRKDKARRWHIDYLLSDGDVRLTAVVAGAMSQKKECTINLRLKETFRAQTPFSGFGSSDCVEHCCSHLLFLGHARSIVERTIRIYEAEADGEVFVFKFS